MRAIEIDPEMVPRETGYVLPEGSRVVGVYEGDELVGVAPLMLVAHVEGFWTGPAPRGRRHQIAQAAWGKMKDVLAEHGLASVLMIAPRPAIAEVVVNLGETELLGQVYNVKV